MKSLIWGPIFAHLARIQAPKFFSEALPLLEVTHCSKLSSQAISRSNKANQRKCETPNFGSDFDLFSPNLGPKNFFWNLQLYQQLKIVPSYHPRQFKVKLIRETEQNAKNLIQHPILTQIQTQKFYSEALPLLQVRHCSKLSSQAI